MFKLISALVLSAIFCAQASAQKFPGVGRAATAAEIKAWDIDVRPDFTGLPVGAGSVKQGQVVWEAKCESCHGTFGEATEVFTPIVGGTTKADIESGRVANLTRADYPQRTTLMKLSQLSTMWDYIRRAMPWNAPKTLSNDEVYAVTAYILNLGDIVPADFVLNEKTIVDAQNKLPNRHGLVIYPALWNVDGRGDVSNAPCMSDCALEKGVTSSLPDFARNAHGNLAEQTRAVGATRGVNTEAAALSPVAATAPTAAPATAPATIVAPSVAPPRATQIAAAALPASASKAAPTVIAAKPSVAAAPSAASLATKHNCSACHQADRKVLGPSYADIAAKYKGDANALKTLSVKIKAGGSGVWGAIPMPPNAALSDADMRALVQWILAGGK